MSNAPAHTPAAKGEGKKNKILLPLILIALVVLLAAAAGLWFTGVLPQMLGGKKAEAAKAAAALASENAPPVAVDVPEIVTNLNAGPRKTAYVKIKIRIIVASNDDAKLIDDAMPQIEDLFQTYLREMRPEELRGSIGSYRLREEFIARIAIAAAPAQVRDVLFTELFTE